MGTLPSNVGYGRVRMRVLQGIADSPDDSDEFPDAIGAQGSVLFIPAVSHVTNLTAEGGPVVIALPNLTGTFDEDGHLCGPDGTRGLYLVASDDTDNNPSGWTYRVAFNIVGISLPDMTIAVPEGSDTDLTLAVQVPSSPGLGTAGLEALVLRVEDLMTGAVLTVNGVEPDENGNIEIEAGGTTLTAYSQVSSLPDYPGSFPPAPHTHDDRYYTEAEINSLLSGKAGTSHTHAQSDVTGLSTALSGKANTSHTHAQGDITGLQTALDGKQPAGTYSTYTGPVVVPVYPDSNGNLPASRPTGLPSGSRVMIVGITEEDLPTWGQDYDTALFMDTP